MVLLRVAHFLINFLENLQAYFLQHYDGEALWLEISDCVLEHIPCHTEDYCVLEDIPCHTENCCLCLCSVSPACVNINLVDWDFPIYPSKSGSCHFIVGFEVSLLLVWVDSC